MSALSGLPGELARTRRDITHWETVLAGNPDSGRIKAALEYERDHEARVVATMRAAGLPVETP